MAHASTTALGGRQSFSSGRSCSSAGNSSMRSAASTNASSCTTKRSTSATALEQPAGKSSSPRMPSSYTSAGPRPCRSGRRCTGSSSGLTCVSSRSTRASATRSARGGSLQSPCGCAPSYLGSCGGRNDAAFRSTLLLGCGRRTCAPCSIPGDRTTIRSGCVNGPIVFLAATAFVSASATLGVSMLRLPSRIDAALAWALLASTVVVATLLVAGAVLDELAAWLVLALNAAVAGLFALAWLALGRGHSKLRRPSIGDVHALVRELRGDRWLLLLLVVAAGEVLWRLTIAYLMPPYAADALWYHLTTVGGWLQEDQIGPSDLSIWSTVYPYNGELLFTWPALLLGDDTFVDAVQLPFAIVAAVAVAGIGRTAGLSTRGAAAAGCLFLLAPIVLSQTTANYTDLIFTAFFLSSFHFVLRFATDLRATGGGSPAHLFVAGLAGGLALGTKVLGVIYLGVLALLLVAHLLAARVRWRLNGKRLVWSLILFVVPVLALGFYHYVETWVRYGNPLYPVRIAAFGVELFSGRSVDWFLTPPLTEGAWWREIWGLWRQDYFFLVQPRFHAYSYDDRGSGLGPLWSYLAIPLLPVFAFRLFRTNGAVLLNVLLPVALMVALQPYRWWSRFTMILIAVGAIAIVAVVEALPR